jgi:hypothetical protein
MNCLLQITAVGIFQMPSGLFLRWLKAIEEDSFPGNLEPASRGESAPVNSGGRKLVCSVEQKNLFLIQELMQRQRLQGVFVAVQAPKSGKELGTQKGDDQSGVSFSRFRK